jgi:drug/metabolite transporter (DMT)-like permease
MTKVLSNKLKVSAYTQATLLSLLAGGAAILTSPLLGGISLTLNLEMVFMIALIVISSGLGSVMYFEGMKNLTSGTAQISFSTILIFNVILSLIFLNLHLSPLNIFGIVLLMVAVLSVTTGKVELNKSGVIKMVISAFLFSIFQLTTSKISTQVSAATYMVIAYLGTVAVIVIYKGKTIAKDLRKTIDKKSLLVTPLLAASLSLGNYIFSYYAYRTAPEPTKVAMLLTSQVVVAVLLSYVFLNEKQQLGKKIMAAVLVVISAILIKS